MIIADETKDISVSNFPFAYAMFMKASFMSAFLDLYTRKSLMYQHLLNIFSKCLVSLISASVTVSVSAMMGRLS